jgi:hypothetical protein
MWASERKLLCTYRSSTSVTADAVEQDKPASSHAMVSSKSTPETQKSTKTRSTPKASLSYIPHAKLEVIVVTVTMVNDAPILVRVHGTNVKDMTSSLASTMVESLISVVERTDRVFPDLLDDLSNKSFGNDKPQTLSVVKFAIKHRNSQESKLHFVPNMDVIAYLSTVFQMQMLAHKTIQHIQKVYPLVEAYINQQWY